MSTKTILFGVVGLVIVASVLGFLVLRHLTDLDRVGVAAERIAAFDLPDGYQPDYAVDMLEYTIAAYKSTDDQSHLVFMQAPSNVIPEDQVFAGYMINDDGSTSWSGATVNHTEQLTVRDQPATLTISDRTNGDGQRYRNVNLVFAGREGTALLVINQPVAQWDGDAVDAFIQSLH